MYYSVLHHLLSFFNHLQSDCDITGRKTTKPFNLAHPTILDFVLEAIIVTKQRFGGNMFITATYTQNCFFVSM